MCSSDLDAAAGLVRRILAQPALRFAGYSSHLGRFSAEPAASAVVAAAFGEATVRLHRETGAWPGILDIGGGWPRQREPESRGPALNPYAIEEHAKAACSALRAALDPVGRALPQLWLEPGRYIVGNASVLLATIGAALEQFQRDERPDAMTHAAEWRTRLAGPLPTQGVGLDAVVRDLVEVDRKSTRLNSSH